MEGLEGYKSVGPVHLTVLQADTHFNHIGVSTCTLAHVCICSSACTNTTSVKCVQCTCANVFLQHHKHALCTHCTFKRIHVNFELPVLSFLTHTCTRFASSVSASCRGDGEVSLSDFEQNPPVACPSHSPWHV